MGLGPRVRLGSGHIALAAAARHSGLDHTAVSGRIVAADHTVADCIDLARTGAAAGRDDTLPVAAGSPAAADGPEYNWELAGRRSLAVAVRTVDGRIGPAGRSFVGRTGLAGCTDRMGRT